ncbi:hypothetical protein CIK05_08280 [Bdellovibrio sp. qaytius]|nr:hypothetical protein CIK05_08280 [Bdellovibrio sp. qaytius]
MLLRLSWLLLVFIITGCTGATNSTLLSEFKPCKENCSTSVSGTISGELAILPDDGEIYSSPEGSDLVEVTGSCKDLGRKSNRILVQVFEGEDDSISPIIDNSIGITCQDNIHTTSLTSTGGTKTCLLISQGIGMADSGSSTSQFPQCFNGRFSFQLRMGRIIRNDPVSATLSDDTNPRARYLVKLKLRTTEGITADSGASTLVVNRALTTPTFSVTKNKENDRCEINFTPSKFRDIRYTLFTTWTGPSYAAAGAMTNTISGTVYVDKQATFPPLGDGTTVEKFYHFGEPIQTPGTIGLMPGVTYTYRMQSGDYSFLNTTTPSLTDYEVIFGAGNVERSAMSGNVSCVMDPAYVSNRTEQNQGTGTPNSCLLQLAGYNTRGYNIEWRVSSSSPSWMITNPTAGFLVSVGGDATTNCRALPTCFVHGDRNPAGFAGSSSATTYIDGAGVVQRFQPNVPYYFAARHYRDTNGNSQYDPGIDQIVGDWSPPTNVTNSADYNHRCTFNSFPVQ